MKALITLLTVLLASSTFAKDRVIDGGWTKKVISRDNLSITVTNKTEVDVWCDFGYKKGSKKYQEVSKAEREEYRIAAFTTEPSETKTVPAEKLAKIKPYKVAFVCVLGGEPENRPPPTPEQAARGKVWSEVFGECMDETKDVVACSTKAQEAKESFQYEPEQ